MKVAILLVLAILCTSSVLNGQIGAIGLFSNSEHSNNCVNGAGFYQAEMWIWCFPGPNGQICAEFRVSYPANLIESTITSNEELISVTLGSLPDGMSVCYNSCQNDWHWIFRQIFYVTDPTITSCTIVSHPDVGAYHFANCLPGYPTEPCSKYCDLYLNAPDDHSYCIPNW